MNMKDLKSEYNNGKIAKPQYIEAMHEIHDVLFDYPEIIKETDIKKIEISSNGVVMTSKILDIKMFCDKKDQRTIPIEMLNFGTYEKEESKFVLQMIDKDSVVFDIGANVGWISLLIAKSIENVKVFSFEPLPQTFQCLCANIAENNMSNIYPANFGFSDEKKSLRFFYYPEGSGNSSIRNLSNRADVEEVDCLVSTLDIYTKENNIYPDFIKCDVEGAELFVFKGGIETIRKCTPIVYTEMLRKWASKFNYHPNEIIELFKNLGYECYIIDGEYLAPISIITESTVETNFFFLHNVNHKKWINKLAK